MTKRTTIEAVVGDITLGNIQIRDGSGGAFVADVNDPGVGLDCLAVQTTPIPGAPSTPTAPKMVEGLDNAVAFGGVAAVTSITVTLDMGSPRGKVKTIRVYQTTPPGVPYTDFSVGIYQANPGAGPFAALPDGPNAIFRYINTGITAAGLILNLAHVAEIVYRNRDVGPLNNLYVVIVAEAGGGVGAAGVYSVELLGEELTT